LIKLPLSLHKLSPSLPFSAAAAAAAKSNSSSNKRQQQQQQKAAAKAATKQPYFFHFPFLKILLYHLNSPLDFFSPHTRKVPYSSKEPLERVKGSVIGRTVRKHS